MILSLKNNALAKVIKCKNYPIMFKSSIDYTLSLAIKVERIF